jgi:hypothetical protein
MLRRFSKEMKRTKSTKTNTNRGIEEISGKNKTNKKPRRSIKLSIGKK